MVWMLWSDKQLKDLIDLRDQGLSGSQIAKAMGPTFTRNMVMGKLKRLRDKKNPHTTIRRAREIVEPIARVGYAPFPATGQCLYAIGPDWCAMPCLEGSAYCPHHHERCHQAPRKVAARAVRQVPQGH